MLLLSLLVVFSVLLFYFYLRTTRKPLGFPPGPPRRPFFGRAPSLLHDVLENSQKYGKVYGFFMGSQPAVMVTDFEVLKELFKREELTARPPKMPLNEARFGHELPELKGQTPGIINSMGRYWKDQRKFLLRGLKYFDFGEASMEGYILTEVEKLIKHLQQKINKETSINQTINISIINVLWIILVGDSFQLDDPRLIRVVQLVTKVCSSNSTSFASLANLIPHSSLSKLPFLKRVSGLVALKHTFDKIKELTDPHVREHMSTLQKDIPRDMMDMILKEMEDVTDESSPFFGNKGEIALYNIFIDVFVAGMETSSSSLVWMILYMVHHPEVQRKVHEELDRVCGRDTLPSLSDKGNLPYTNAVIHESMRITGLGYVGLPHFTTAQVNIKGYTVPKGSTVFGSLYAIMNDPTYWKEPKKFNPDRFIESGKFVPDERVIPFGTGKRICPGQALAEKQVYLFFTGLMQAFEIVPPESAQLPGYGIRVTNPIGITRTPPNYKIVFGSRLG